MAFQQPSESVLDALDDVVQKRLHNTEGAGMSRMPTVQEHFRRFKPDGTAEELPVRSLEEQGDSVVLYLGGLGLHEPAITKEAWNARSEHDRREISDPLPMTKLRSAARVPDGWELWKTGQQALAAFEKSDRYVSSQGPWVVDARAVRIDREECLQCHKNKPTRGADLHRVGDQLVRRRQGNSTPGADAVEPMRVGDVVGVAIYLYVREPRAGTQGVAGGSRVRESRR